METKKCIVCSEEHPIESYRIYDGKYRANKCSKCINPNKVAGRVGVTVLHQCSRCKKKKKRANFPQDKRSKFGIRGVCKKCNSTDKKKDYEKHIDRHKKTMRKNHLRRKYGISQEEYELKLIEQNNCCEICQRSTSELSRKMLFVDHNHKTGKTRGLLCPSCNRLIGVSIEKIEILNRAIQYLKKYE